MDISPNSCHLVRRTVLICSKMGGFPKNFPISECWNRRRARATESLSKRMNSDVEAFSLRSTGPSTSGEGLEGRFLTAAAISAHEGGEGVGGGPPLAMARGEKEQGWLREQGWQESEDLGWTNSSFHSPRIKNYLRFTVN